MTRGCPPAPYLQKLTCRRSVVPGHVADDFVGDWRNRAVKPPGSIAAAHTDLGAHVNVHAQLGLARQRVATIDTTSILLD